MKMDMPIRSLTNFRIRLSVNPKEQYGSLTNFRLRLYYFWLSSVNPKEQYVFL